LEKVFEEKEKWPGKTYKTSNGARASLTRPGNDSVAVDCILTHASEAVDASTAHG